jgi:hypothetical protein
MTPITSGAASAAPFFFACVRVTFTMLSMRYLGRLSPAFSFGHAHVLAVLLFDYQNRRA